jgi:hypothetical protein
LERVNYDLYLLYYRSIYISKIIAFFFKNKTGCHANFLARSQICKKRPLDWECLPVCLPVRPQATTRLPLHGSSWNLIFEILLV